MSIAAVQDSIFAGSSSGPVAATDTALILFTGILQSENVDRDDVFQAFALRVIGWLEVHWSLRRSGSPLCELHD